MQDLIHEDAPCAGSLEELLHFTVGLGSRGRPCDAVIWGCGKPTGRLAAEHFAQNVAPRFPGLRWAIAAQNQEDAEAVCESLREHWPSAQPLAFSGSIDDRQSIDDVVRQTHVLLAVADPFAELNDPVVDACVRLGTDYIDVMGGADWASNLSDSYGRAAEKSGVIIAPLTSERANAFETSRAARRGGVSDAAAPKRLQFLDRREEVWDHDDPGIECVALAAGSPHWLCLDEDDEAAGDAAGRELARFQAAAALVEGGVQLLQLRKRMELHLRGGVVAASASGASFPQSFKEQVVASLRANSRL